MKFSIYKSFIKDSKSLSKNVLDDIKDFLIEIDQAERILDLKNVKKLTGFNTAYRRRIGNYRIGFFLAENNTIELVRILKRSDIYKLFP